MKVNQSSEVVQFQMEGNYPKGETLYVPIYADIVTQLGRDLEDSAKFALVLDRDEKRKDLVSVCITVYNECGEYLKNSVDAIIDNILYCHKVGYQSAKQYQICVIVDGSTSMSASLATYAESLGIYFPHRNVEKAEFHIFRTELSVPFCDEFISRESEQQRVVSFAQGRKVTADIDVLFCISTSNKGKLNSHRWYFSFLCSIFNPTFCVQVDVGVVPNIRALHILSETLIKNHNAGAVAANSTVCAPQSAFNLLNGWQYASFLSERLVVWPVEVVLGYLSVLPGQMHMLRWSALKPCHLSNSEALHSQQAGKFVGKPTKGVLDNYLKDIDQLATFEANMYLAEDRILGIDLAFGEQKSWDLEYAVDAEAVVDSCGTWNELLKQRRRWICGALACKPYMLTRATNSIFHDGISVKTLKRIASIIYFAIFMIIEWFGPAISIGLFTQLYTSTAQSMQAQSFGLLTPFLTFGLTFLFVVSLGLFAFQLVLAIRGKLGIWTERFLRISVIFQAMFMGLLALYSAANYTIISAEVQLFFALYVLVHATILAVVFLMSSYHGTRLLFVLPLYMLSSLYVGYVLQTFAICNMSDTSWGTKGHDTPINRSWLGRHGDFSRQLYKIVSTSLFLGSNGLILCAILYYQWTYNFIISVLMLSFGAITLAKYVALQRKFRPDLHHANDASAFVGD